MITFCLFRDHGNQARAATIEHGESFNAQDEECRKQVTSQLLNFDYNRGFLFVGPFDSVDDVDVIPERGEITDVQELKII